MNYDEEAFEKYAREASRFNCIIFDRELEATRLKFALPREINKLHVRCSISTNYKAQSKPITVCEFAKSID